MSTDFLPALSAVGVGLLGGVALLLKARSGERLPEPVVAERVELERQRDGLYEELRVLGLEAEKMPEGVYQQERQRLEVEAAKVLMGLDRLGAGSTAKAPTRVAERHPQLVGAVWGAAIVGFIAATWFGLDRYSAPRGEGGSITGNAQTQGAMAAPEEEEDPAQMAELIRLQATAEAKPDDIEAQNAYAHVLIRANKLMEAWKISETVVKKDDGNVEARTHQGIVLLGIGETDMSRGMFDKVLTAHPDATEALAYRGLLYMREGDKEKAIASWEKVISLDPSQEEMLRPMITMVKTGSMPMGAGGPPSGAAGGAAGGAAVADGPSITGEIQVDPKLAASIPPGTILFVLARPPGATGGRPMAAKRIPIEGFPIKFSLGPADNPMGGGLSGSMVITARIDRDGNPTTKGPDDLEGRTDTVEPGASGLTITLMPPAP